MMTPNQPTSPAPDSKRLVKKPPPLLEAPRSRAVCPVCGKASYSRGGVHPQCAVNKADAIQTALRKANAATAAPKPAPAPEQRWTKLCTSCGRRIAARRVQCDCGQIQIKQRPDDTGVVSQGSIG